MEIPLTLVPFFSAGRERGKKVGSSSQSVRPIVGKSNPVPFFSAGRERGMKAGVFFTVRPANRRQMACSGTFSGLGLVVE